MTSASSASFGTDEHPEVAEISALTEGLLPPERSADVHAHLSDCELCADVRTSLEEIRSALGTLPGPARMPSDVAGRIDAALAAEALLDATASAIDTNQNTSGAASSAEEPDGVSRETPGSSAVSRETASTGRPATRPTRRPTGQARGTTGPGRPGSRPRRWRTALLATVSAAVVVLGGLLLSGVEPNSSNADGGGRQVVSDSGRSEHAPADAALEARVRSLLADSGTTGNPRPQEKAEPGPSEFSTKASPNAPLSTVTPTAPACVREGISRDETPLAVGKDVYEGRQAYIVVLPHGSDGTRVDAYVVDADCVGEASSAPGTVLTQRTYTR
ncbi:MAG TPA: hypothetical protein VE546_00095 [Streptomyces sp.]|uniref:hypothetical protein n=1 Tax=Streptomyces sp. TaxID=1931 RepID=UPI002D2E6635|nr:hypothetical protein [Streptomyces sp.]HZG01967.1 hypothetical protein [Streptomyces sp.]